MSRYELEAKAIGAFLYSSYKQARQTRHNSGGGGGLQRDTHDVTKGRLRFFLFLFDKNIHFLAFLRKAFKKSLLLRIFSQSD